MIFLLMQICLVEALEVNMLVRVVVLKWKEDGRKKRLEEIGKGDAWLKKQTGEAPIEV